jgi:hypothetical protein
LKIHGSDVEMSTSFEVMADSVKVAHVGSSFEEPQWETLRSPHISHVIWYMLHLKVVSKVKLHIVRFVRARAFTLIQ